MHRALLIASRLVTRAASSSAYDLIAGCHPFAAKDLADLVIELDAMGYVDPLQANGNAPCQRNRVPGSRASLSGDK